MLIPKEYLTNYGEIFVNTVESMFSYWKLCYLTVTDFIYMSMYKCMFVLIHGQIYHFDVFECFRNVKENQGESSHFMNS